MARSSGWWLALVALGGCSGRGCGAEPAPGAAASATSVAATAQAPSVDIAPSTQTLPSEVAWGTQAMAHLPAGCGGVIRIQARAIATHPLLGPSLQRLLERPTQVQNTSAAQQAFWEFLSAAKLDPLRDVEQVAVCLSDASASPLWVVAGNFKDNLVQLLKAHAPASEGVSLETHAGVAVLRRGNSSLLQAEDRVLLMGNDLPALQSARQLSAAHAGYGVPQRGELAFALSSPLLTTLSSSVPGSSKGQLAPAAVTGSLELSSGNLLLESELGTAERAERFKTWLSALVEAVVPPASIGALRPGSTAPASAAPGLPGNGSLPAAAGAHLSWLKDTRFEVDGSRVKVQVVVPIAGLALLLGQATR